MADVGPIARALAVIRVLSRSSEPLRVKELADTLGLPMSTSHRYLDLLVEGGFVEKHSQHRYSVGAELLLAAKAIMEKPSLFSSAPSVLDDVNSSTGEAAVFNLYSRRHKVVSYVASSRCRQQPSWTLKLDCQQPLAWGASGLAMLAFLPERIQRGIIRRSELSPAKGALLDPGMMTSKLKEIRLRGYAVTQEERIPGAAGIAVPILQRNEVAGSMGLIIPLGRFERRMCDDYGQVLKEAARRALAVVDNAH